MNNQRIIGLTGGVGTGKTTVSNYLGDTYHLPVLDADVYAREVVQPGCPVLEEIVERYGLVILLPDGSLDRQQLGKIIFNSEPERLWLERRIHPYVRDRIEVELPILNVEKYPIVVLVVPLLFEARMTDLVTEIWVVRCDEIQQLQRVIERDRLPLEQAKARIGSQMSLEKKVAMADIVLDNSSTVEELLKQVDLALNRPFS